jgi:hypothetical protein
MLQALRANRSLQKLLGYGGLFTSMGTLICCALPSALVLLGFGAGLASILGEFPQLIWLSENKAMVFGVSFFMLGLSWLGQRIAAREVCPVDSREACQSAKSWSRPIFFTTLAINVVGFIYAFVLPELI